MADRIHVIVTLVNGWCVAITSNEKKNNELAHCIQ